jgi:hypothetical protein
MARRAPSLVLAATVWSATYIACGAGPATAQEVSFGRDIQPILARNCFACHGPDEGQRQADLRLDQRESAVASGAIRPGDPAASELIRRIFSTDPAEQMPPPDAHSHLSDAHKQQLRDWVAAGANYQPHWAFAPLQRAPLPAATGAPAEWSGNPIDRFVLDRLHREGLHPSPPADRYALVRRVYLDLLGFPPTPAEADDFVNDHQPEAYERLVDRLLASPHFGERWARLWLDLARYSDTNGYEKDRPRSIWPYRDWVIRAINEDLPFDQFTIEQLAGDMLPEATLDQRIATGFHRNTMLNEEGGIDPLEFRYYAMVDRVATTGTVWLGLTTGCAQCHSHKYDPISHTEYFSLMALLDNADEPDLRLPDPEVAARRASIEAEIARREAELPGRFPLPAEAPPDALRHPFFYQGLADCLAAERRSLADWTTLVPSRMTTNLPRLVLQEDGSILSTGDITKRDVYTLSLPLDALPAPLTALRLEVLPDERLPGGGPGRSFYEGRQGDFFLSEIVARRHGQAIPFAGASHSYGKISVGNGTAAAGNVIDGDGSTGWSTAEGEGRRHELVLTLAAPLPAEGELELELLFERHYAASLGRFRLSATTAPQAVLASGLTPEAQAIVLRDETDWTDADRTELERAFCRTSPELAEARRPIDQLRRSMPDFPTTLVLEERPADHPRPTPRRHRGEYLNPREAVEPGIPAVLAACAASPPGDRLEFARWLASEENPLIARVEVNRLWQALFGRGLVASAADFGTQSEPPSHPELLDWLACEFMDRGWSRKGMLRLIVTSQTYRQSSAAAPEHYRQDPDNRLLSRGPRQRVDAEIVRDSLLRASGLLSPKVGGPSVYPPQPESVTALAYGKAEWTPSTGPDRYRRSLYTFSKRTAPFAAYSTFDAPSGETCVARRDRSNTPLQALTLLNDEMILELVRALAADVCRENPAQQRAAALFRRVLTRPPTPEELAAIREFHAGQMARLEAGELDGASIAGAGDAPADLAAWTLVARALVNLDEAIVKP